MQAIIDIYRGAEVFKRLKVAYEATMKRKVMITISLWGVFVFILVLALFLFGIFQILPWLNGLELYLL